jgi:hypothetical protein
VETEKLTTRLQNKTCTKSQIKNHKKRHELTDQTKTQHKNPEHMYLNFLTSPTPSVEKL